MTTRPNDPPCTCGGSGCCTVCVLNDLGLEAALLTTAHDRLAQVANNVVPLRPALDNRLHSVHVDHRRGDR